MAANEHIIKAPGMMKNLAVGGHLTTADQILDETIGKEQAQINAELYALITSLPVSDGTDVESGNAYIDFETRCVKVKE